MKAYPIIINLEGKKVGIVGGGRVAARKVAKLLKLGIRPRLVSPVLTKNIDPRRVEWVQQDYQRELVADCDLLFACTDNRIVNAQVRAEASPGQLVNDTSDKHHSDFYNLATTTVSDITVAVSTMGKSPALAKQIKTELTEWLRKRFQGD